MLFTPGYPGFLRGLAPAGPGEFVVTTANGDVARYRPATSETEVLAGGFDQLYGVDVAPDGSAVVVEQGTGRVLAIRSGATEVLAAGLQVARRRRDRPRRCGPGRGVGSRPGGDGGRRPGRNPASTA